MTCVSRSRTFCAIPIVYGVVVENQHDAGEPDQRCGAQILQMRNARHHDLDRNRDLLLHFLGRPARPLRDDGDVVVGDIGVRLDRQVVERDGAPDQQQDGHRQDHEPVVEREIDKTANHLLLHRILQHERVLRPVARRDPETTSCMSCEHVSAGDFDSAECAFSGGHVDPFAVVQMQDRGRGHRVCLRHRRRKRLR